MNKHISELAPDRLRHVCNPGDLAFEVTDDLAFESDIIGQDRAVEAMEFGLDIKSPGFNIFVMGPVGSGRHSILKRIVERKAAGEPAPADWVYVNDFASHGTPQAIRLPPGRGRQMRTSMERFSNTLAERLQRAFETDRYVEAREELEQNYRALEREALASVEVACREHDCALVRSPSGLYLAPLRNGDLLSPEDISRLDTEEQARIQQALDDLDDLLDDTMRHLRDHERRVQADIDRLDREVADFTIRPLLEELQVKYADQEEVQVFLEDVREDVLSNVAFFRSEDASGRDLESESLLDVPVTKRYRVNLLVDNSELEGAPVVTIERPYYPQVFGAVEYDVHYGVSVTDHTLIRAGALHRANGGYLIVDAAALLEDYDVWVGLKHALSTQRIRIESPDGQRLVRTVTPDPEPIPLDVKVVLIGSPYVFYTLYELDDDFGKFFKVQADFHTEVDRTQESEQAYGRFIRMLCHQENLHSFTAAATARVVEYG
ncbi:MAG: AAA family ATPase, partial [Anaerolineae bacterium]